MYFVDTSEKNIFYMNFIMRDSGRKAQNYHIFLHWAFSLHNVVNQVDVEENSQRQNNAGESWSCENGGVNYYRV